MLRQLPVRARSGRTGGAVRAGGDTHRRPRREELRPAINPRSRSRESGEPAAPGCSLSPADAAFLYLERKEIPLAIACVTIFDGPIPFDKFVATIVSKLHQVPRYLQVVVMPPLNISLPTWEDDPHFDIRRHVFRVTVDSPGGEVELEALVGRIFSQLLDRDKPLWEIYVVDGLKDGRGAVIWRLHHALADGVSANRLLELFLDSSPEGSPPVRSPRSGRRQASSSPPGGGISSVVRTTLGSLIATERGLLGFAEALLGDAERGESKSLLRLLPELLMSVERLPFNKPCGGGRKFCWADFDMTEVKAIREVAGGRVNDVILTVLTRALAHYVKLHGQSIVNRFVRIVCPVSLRKPGQEENLGNQISFMPVALPLDVRSPLEMLRAVAARTEAMKGSGVASLVGLMALGIAKAPPPLQALFWWGLPELILPLPLFNMICTNVPGPSIPLYAVGRRMIASYPQVPTGYDLGINCAVESYDGKLFFGLVADARVASDVNRLRDFLYVAFEELSRAARKKARAEARTNRHQRGEAPPGKRPARTRPAKAVEAAPPGPGAAGTPSQTTAAPVNRVTTAA